jgi:hypothetical protein
MEDELKAVVPSRYTITVSAAQLRTVDSARAEWEVDLAAYFLEILRENSWSAIGRPRITIAYDPALTGDEVRVAVEEPDIIYNGGPFRIPRGDGQVWAALTFVIVLIACGFLIVGILRPDWLDEFPVSFPWTVRPAQPLVLPWDSDGEQPVSWWGSARDAILGRAPGGSRGEVVASPCLAVRAGEPSTRAATLPGSCIQRGTILTWQEGQIARGESFRGEDRWLEVGEAGPEWGRNVGQKLYVWMGGVEKR